MREMSKIDEMEAALRAGKPLPYTVLPSGDLANDDGNPASLDEMQEILLRHKSPISSVLATVSVIHEDGTEETYSFRGEHAQMQRDFGFDEEQPAEQLHCTRTPNGQHRTTIKLWGGMANFDDLRQGRK